MKLEKITNFKEWSTSYINDLPDSSFLYIESGGKKDSEGKTMPRSLRHLPYKDKEGKLDMPHLRNAISRAPQVKDKGGKPLSDSLVKKIQEKARKLLGKDMEENRMKDDKAEIAIAKFEDESVIQKVKEIISKLETAEDLDSVKALVPELKSLLPSVEEPAEEVAEEAAEAKEEEKAEEVEEKAEEAVEGEDAAKEASEKLAEVVAEATAESVEEPVPEEGAVSEEAPSVEESPAVEEPAKAEQPASLSEVLDLNDKLIVKLKEATDEIDRLEKENNQFKEKVEVLDKQVSAFKEQELKKTQERKQAKFNEVFEKYVSFFKVKEEAQDAIRKEMSTFSEGILDNIAKQIDAKNLAEMKEEPEVDTKPSSQLEAEGKVQEAKNSISWDELTPGEKTKFLFERAKSLANN